MTRVQTREEEYKEALRRVNHLSRRPDGLTKKDLVRELRRITREVLR